MKKSTRNLAILVVVVAAVYGGYSAIFKSVSVRFRVTMQVMDGDQVRTGSSVIEVEYPIYPDGLFPAQETGIRQVIGYATTVDLREKGLLFLTFSGAHLGSEFRRQHFRCFLSDIACLPFAAYDTPKQGVDARFRDQKVALDELSRQSGPREVAFYNLPELVQFLDMNDRGTERAVSPFDLAASFGPGVRLGRVVVQLTNDPITPEPSIWPRWLKIKRQNAKFRGYENG